MQAVSLSQQRVVRDPSKGRICEFIEPGIPTTVRAVLAEVASKTRTLRLRGICSPQDLLTRKPLEV